MSEITVIFISGFLTPTGWLSYPEDLIPPHVNMITVFPSPTGSLHDRACQVFYELIGGTIDYGLDHSRFHNHAQFGRQFRNGKHPRWSSKCPIIIIGHSFGGSTAWVLQNYLAQKKFPGYETDASWVKGIICVNSPLNGALQVYGKGMDFSHPPVVRWGSVGCLIGWVVQWTEYFKIKSIRAFMDFQQDHWNLTWRNPEATKRLVLSLFGYCLHSGTDNIAYDASILSQLEWAKHLHTYSDSHYISLVGKLEPASVLNTSILLNFSKIYGQIAKRARSEAPPVVNGVDTSQWLCSGSDGLLSVHTQEYPRLMEVHPAQELAEEYSTTDMTAEETQDDAKAPRRRTSTTLSLEKGVWYYKHCNISHLSAALACRETWVEVMQLLQVLVLQEEEEQLPSSATRNDTSSSTRRTRSSIDCTHMHVCPQKQRAAPERSPDMQMVHFHMPCNHSSVGMAYRPGKICRTIALILTWYCFYYLSSATVTSNNDTDTDNHTGTATVEVNRGFLISCGFLLTFVWQYYKPPNPELESKSSKSAGSPTAVNYLPNYTMVYSDILEIACATWRIYVRYKHLLPSSLLSFIITTTAAAAGGGGRTHSSTTSSATNRTRQTGQQQCSFLWEYILLSLLPRPLMDYNLPITKLIFAVLNFTLTLHFPVAETDAPYSYVPLSTLIDEYLLLYWLCFAALPKLSWLQIYLPFSPIAKYVRFGASNRMIEALIWTNTAVFLTTWLVYICRVTLMLQAVTSLSFDSGIHQLDFIFLKILHSSIAYYGLWLLLAVLLPLNKFQELSDCIQYVLIRSKYHFNE